MPGIVRSNSASIAKHEIDRIDGGQTQIRKTFVRSDGAIVWFCRNEFANDRIDALLACAIGNIHHCRFLEFSRREPYRGYHPIPPRPVKPGEQL